MFLYHGYQKENNDVLNLLWRVQAAFFDDTLSPYLRNYFFTSAVQGISDCFNLQTLFENIDIGIDPLNLHITFVSIPDQTMYVLNASELFLFCYGYLDIQNNGIDSISDT